MRTPRIAFLLVLLAATAVAQQPGSTSYTPDRKTDAPTFMNSEVVRIDRASNRITFRSESGETTLTVEGEALTAIGSLHAGDKVVVGYRIVKDADGRETRYVTSVVPASPTSGEPGGRRVPATLIAGSTVRARVLSLDRGRRRVTVIDESGGLRTLDVRRGVSGLDVLQPGANIAFNLGAAGTGVNVTRITSLGNTAVFATGVAFPSVSGQFVAFNADTGIVTLDTPTAGRVTFPVGSAVAGGLSGLRPGDNLSLTFDVTTSTTPVGTLATITGVQPARGQLVPAGVVAGTSPLLNPVPNVPVQAAAQAAVLPPAGAKEPLSADDVGAMRAQGEADLAASAVALSAAANAMDVAWAGFKSQCLPGFTAERVTAGREWYLLAQGRILTPSDDACRALSTDLTNRAQGFIQQLDTVEDAARKADVLPVRVREVFDRHRLR